MQKLSVEEVKSLVFVTQAGRPMSPLQAEAMTLQVGEALVIEEAEWKLNSPIASSFSSIGKRHGKKFSVRKRPGRPLGWYVLRVA